MRLMGLLALSMQWKQVQYLLAASSFSREEKENTETAISFFVLLKRRTGTNEAFLSKLKWLLSVCNRTDLLNIVCDYHKDNPDLLTEPPLYFSVPESIRAGFKPQHDQSDCFRSTLIKISQAIGKQQLEIMVVLSPTPEAGKESIRTGHELFDQMERHGCICENDTELLQEMLELLQLSKPLGFLLQYQREFPSVVYNPVSHGGGYSTPEPFHESRHLPHPVQTIGQDSSPSLSVDGSQPYSLLSRSSSYVTMIVRFVLSGLMLLGSSTFRQCPNLRQLDSAKQSESDIREET